MKVVSYYLVMGSLMYAQVCTRPDIAFFVNMLSKYLNDPGQSHRKAAKKVLRYLQGTKDLMLIYRRTNTLEVVGFSDFDYVSYVDDKKFTSGYIFMMVEGAISWESVKQILTSMWRVMRLLVMQYGCGTSFLDVVHSISRPLKLFCNNSAVVSFSKNTSSTSHSKHIDVKFFFVKKKVAESFISIEHMPTTSILTDPLTKGLLICVFQHYPHGIVRSLHYLFK